MRILIDARLSNDYVGGVKKALEGLALSFKLADLEDLDFIWLVSAESSDWLKSYLPPNSEIVKMPISNPKFSKLKFLTSRLIRKSKTGDIFLSKIRSSGLFKYRIPAQPGLIDSLSFDLVHFPMQFGFKTSHPSIYQPHDFQHIHLPEYFSAEMLVIRQIGMESMMKQSSKIVVGAEWTKRDVAELFPEYAEKVLNIPVYPRLLTKISESSHPFFDKKREYILYPAMDWPHKNHVGLIKVFAEITEDFKEHYLVLSGGNLDKNKEITALVSRLGISEKVIFTGFLSEDELFHFYSHAQILVMPSFFESESLPIWEAFQLRIPVLASNVTAIPDQVSESALLFDPSDPDDFRVNLVELLNNPTMRECLADRAMARVSRLTSINSALGYRFSYRRALNLKIDDTDNNWLENGFTF